jgi:hypothetical protein
MPPSQIGGAAPVIAVPPPGGETDMMADVLRHLTTEVVRRLLWWRRVQAARAWRDAEREQAALHSEAIRRILDQHRERSA